MEGAADQVETKGPTSFFHGKEDKDYQGVDACGLGCMCVCACVEGGLVCVYACACACVCVLRRVCEGVCEGGGMGVGARFTVCGIGGRWGNSA